MSDIDDFALKLLQRAQARQQVISENLNKENESHDKTKIDMMIQKISEISPKKKDSEVFCNNTNQILNLSSSPRRSPMKNQVAAVVNKSNENIQAAKIACDDLDGDTEQNNSSNVSNFESDISIDDGKLNDIESLTNIPEEFKTPDTKENSTAGIKSETRRTLKRLGQLYGDANIASPVHKHSELEKTPETPQSESAGNKFRSSPVARRSRLHALACTINEWEDDLSYHCSPNSRFNVSVVSKGGRGRSPPKAFASPLNAESNMVRNSLQTNKAGISNYNASLASTPKPKIVTEVYACKTNGEGHTTPTNAKALSQPLCVSSKKDRGLVIERKMYMQNSDMHKNENTSEHAWDRSILNALESQGFVPTPKKDKLVYDYATPQGNAAKTSPEKRAIANNSHLSSPKNGNRAPSPIKIIASPKKPDRASSPGKTVTSPMKETTFASAIAAAQAKISSPGKSDNAPRVVDSIRKKFEFGGRSPTKVTETKPVPPPAKKVETSQPKASVAQRAAMYETKLNQSVVEKDPTEMSVAERARLFEKQAFYRTPKTIVPEPPKPLRAFTTITPVSTGPISQPQKLNLPVKEIEPPMLSDTSFDDDAEMFQLPPPPPPMFQQPMASPKASPNRSRRQSKSPTPKRSMSPKSQYPGSRDVKRIKINEPKDGKMYPSLTDIEATETETEVCTETEDEPMYEDEDMDSETSYMSASSLGKVIEQVAKQMSPARSPVRSPIKSPPRRNRHYRPTEDFSASLACRQIDAYIDDALEGQDYTLDTLIEAELEAHASSTPIADSSMDKSDDTNTKSAVTVISDETRKPSQIKLDFGDVDDAEYEDANSSFGSFATTREDLPEKVRPVDDARKEPETNVDTDVSFSCLDETPESDISYNTESESKIPLEIQDQESNPLSTSSPHGHYVARTEDSPANSNTPLMHTVSFYRKQQSKKYGTATPTTSHSNDRAQNSPDRNTIDKKDVGDLIKKMEEEVSGHVKSIAQVSKALNLCKATVEFSESTENVECEKVLLVATQKRTGLLNEIHRLKTEGVLSKKSMFSPGKHDLGPSCRGNMALSNVEVQLKRDFVSRAMKGDTVYHFVLLTKYRHQIDASALISVGNGMSSSNIQGGILHFPNTFTVGSLEPEFCVKLEIYLLQTQKEYLPHEAKYHIKREPKTGMLTPKKLKLDTHTAKYLGRPFQQSPAGPDAIRTTNFSLCGSLSIDISTLQRSHWTLEKNMTVCPLEGSVSIKIQCSAEGGIEEKGFLTLFDDVSGYGAWHRRWCKLTPSQLSFWRYPEDETKKEPLGAISLRKCVTNRVGPVPRDVCARANTFLLVTTRSPYEDDKDTLVTSCHSEYTAVRHLISADTKEERDVWCKQFNRALANLRAWDPHAHSPDDTLF